MKRWPWKHAAGSFLAVAVGRAYVPSYAHVPLARLTREIDSWDSRLEWFVLVRLL